VVMGRRRLTVAAAALVTGVYAAQVVVPAADTSPAPITPRASCCSKSPRSFISQNSPDGAKPKLPPPPGKPS
jgi:hypothetical protein